MRLLLISALLLVLLGCVTVNNENNSTAVIPKNSTNSNPVKNITPFFNPPPNYTYFSSPLFLIYYPKTWTYTNPKNGIFLFSSPDDSASDPVVEEFVVEIGSGNQSTAKDYKAYEMKLLTPSDRITKEENITFKGKSVYSIEYEGSAGDSQNTTVFYKTIYFRNGDWVYRLSYDVEKSRLSQYGPVMQSILDQFVIGSG
ncbi:hypothetical protein HZC07_03310 [Candidatus Micrarchaeota archaeon]|nr:hypothetical protein [Candidatus Micrarchaeota archaeon]